MGTESTPSTNFVAYATDLTAHFSAQTEDATTKDTTDTTGGWLVYDVTARSGDIQFSAILAVLDGQTIDDGGYYLEDFIEKVNDTAVDWKLLFVGGSKNRVKSKTLCTGKGKITNLQMSGQNRQNATFSGTINLYGPITVGSD